MLDHPLIEMLGEVGEPEKQELLGNAMGLLFAVDWPEPFGLAMIEAMACGTPVIAYPCGSIPEVVDEGITGYIINSQEEAVKAVENLPLISRKLCRETFEQRFSAKRMAQDYLKIYTSLNKSGERSITNILKSYPEKIAYGKEA